MTGVDLTESIIPRSDQLNSDDMLTGPRTVTITDVRAGSVEQPVDIHLAEFPGRPFKPSKTVRRILVAAWGKDGDAYVGRRLTLYRDPDVRFGGQDVGGIRVSHMSDIDKPMKLALTVSKGKRAPFTVQPLPDAPPTSEPISPRQLTALNAAMTQDLGLTDRGDKLAYLSKALGREVGSSKDVTHDEASNLLDRISRGPQKRAHILPVDPPSDPPPEPAFDEPPAEFQGEAVERGK